MALWVCGGESGCGTRYAVGLFRCPRCHNTAFFEDGDPMGKISRHAGASVAEPDTAADAAPEAEPQVEYHGEAGPESVEPLDVTEHLAGPAEPVTEPEGGEGSSPGSSSSASTEPQQTNSEPSEPKNPQPAPTTASRSGKARMAKRSVRSTAGDRETGTSAADDGEEA